MLNKKGVMEVVKSFDLPSNEYLIYSGAVLAVHEIRETEDIDILVSEKLFEELETDGTWRVTFQRNVKLLQRGVVEITSRLHWNDYQMSLDEAVEDKDVINGVNFMNLQEVIKFKQVMGRKKDKKDIVLIKKYLQDTV